MNERDVIKNIRKMGVESLPPAEYEQLENIIRLLQLNRKELNNTCPVCESPLEDAGVCSDIGSNNCGY